MTQVRWNGAEQAKATYARRNMIYLSVVYIMYYIDKYIIIIRIQVAFSIGTVPDRSNVHRTERRRTGRNGPIGTGRIETCCGGLKRSETRRNGRKERHKKKTAPCGAVRDGLERSEHSDREQSGTAVFAEEQNRIIPACGIHLAVRKRLQNVPEI